MSDLHLESHKQWSRKPTTAKWKGENFYLYRKILLLWHDLLQQVKVLMLASWNYVDDDDDNT